MPQFARGRNAQGKTTLYDMEVDSGQKHVLTACQDRNIRVYNVTTGKHSKTFKGSVSDDGSLIKVVLGKINNLKLIINRCSITILKNLSIAISSILMIGIKRYSLNNYIQLNLCIGNTDIPFDYIINGSNNFAINV